MTEGVTREGAGGTTAARIHPLPRCRAGPARKEAASTSPVLVRRSSVRFLASKRQIKEKWLHVHIDFCPQFAGCRGVGRSGWIGGSRVCGRTVGRLRVVAERETTNLCVPSSSSSFSASYSTYSSSSSSSRSSSLSLRLLRMSTTGCFSLPLFLPTTPFAFLPPSLSPSCTLRLPSAVHPLLSPFPFPSSVRRSLARSLAHPLRRPAPPICELALAPCPPLSPSVCLASSFPSFIPSRRAPAPLVVPSSFCVPLAPPVGFFYPPFASAVPRTLWSFSLSLAALRSFSVSPFLLPRRSRPFLSSSSPPRVAPHPSSTANPFASISNPLFLSFRIHSARLPFVPSAALTCPCSPL